MGDEQTLVRRRRWLMGVTAVAAAAVGGGVAWWRHRLEPLDPAQALPPGFWDWQSTDAQGAALPMAAFKGKPLLLNFWATWCPPCVHELPLLNRFYQQHRAAGWQVLGVAIDRPESVRTFLQRTPLDFPSALAALDGTALARSLGNARGSLPFTVVIGADGRVLARKMGQIDENDLQQWLGLK